MRAIAIIFLMLLGPLLAHANDINISTVTQNGNTVFFLQAGAFSLEKDAQQRQKELAKQVNQAVNIKNLADKHLFLVEIGPIDDYQEARTLKNTLSLNKIKEIPITQTNTSSPLLTAQQRSPNKAGQHEVPLGSKLWNLRNADIKAVIAEVSRVTGKNFIIDPRVQGKVSIVSSTAMSNQELYQVFLSVLQVSGYAAIPSGDVIKIIPNIDAKTQSSDLLTELSHAPKGDEMMVAVVPIHYVSAEQLVPVLRPLMPQWSSVSSYAPSNMLILSGRANNIKSLAHIIKQVDSATNSDIDMFPLQNALAMDIAATLKELVKVQLNSGKAPLSISSDDRSNAILVSGSKTDRIRLGMLILKLDKKSSQGLHANTQVVYLNYLRAEDLVPILAGIAQANFSGNVGTTIGKITVPVLDSTNPQSNISGAGNDQNTSTPPAQSAPSNSEATANTSATSTQNEGSTKPTVQIIAEPNTNSIILNAPSSIIRILKSVINRLDIKPAQLLIEAMVAEINQDDVNNLGIEWGYTQQASSGTTTTNTFRPGFAIINSKTSIDNFQAQIYALAREQKANILSTPSVVVLDNRQAKILVGKQVSVASTNYPNNANGTTTSSSPYTTFNRVNVALHLYVRPQITRNQGIQLQIDQGNDTIDNASLVSTDAGENTNPTFKISSIVTSVHVESGNVVVLGGLTQDSLSDDNNRIPILSKIPGIGRAFQRNIHAREKRVLMVFIKPIILRNERENLQVTGDKYNDVRQYQLDWIRSEEIYEQSNNKEVFDPLTQASLPRPFTNRPLLNATASK